MIIENKSCFRRGKLKVTWGRKATDPRNNDLRIAGLAKRQLQTKEAVMIKRNLSTSIMMLGVLLLLLSIEAYATPIVANVAVDTGDKSSIIISGSSFGTKSTAAPIRYDDFETGTVGHEVTTDFPWWSKSSNSTIPIDGTHARGAKSILHSLKAGLNSSESGNRVSILMKNNIGFATTGKIYISWWTYFDRAKETFLNAGGYSQVKELDLCGELSATGSVTKFPDLEYVHYMYNIGPGQYTKIFQAEYYNNTGIAAGGVVLDVKDHELNLHDLDTPTGWYHTAMEIDMGDAGVANGSRKIWLSDYNHATSYFKVSTTNDLVLGDSGNMNRINALKLGWYRGYTTQGETNIWHDDIYIDNSWARIEIGDAATYDNCTHREIQIPQAWNSDKISVKFNLGSFKPGGKVYFFVVDENGAVSNGKDFTIPSNYSVPKQFAPTKVVTP